MMNFIPRRVGTLSLVPGSCERKERLIHLRKLTGVISHLMHWVLR